MKWFALALFVLNFAVLAITLYRKDDSTGWFAATAMALNWTVAEFQLAALRTIA